MSAASLLFEVGSRPDRALVAELAARTGQFSISLVPELASLPDPDGRANWLELVIQGLTFDLYGLAPRAPAPLLQARHLFGLSPETRQRPLEAVTLEPGPHLAGGRQMLPVLRSLALQAAHLAALPGVVAVAWHAAHAWSAPEFFRGGVVRWIEGGAFPALGLAALAPTPAGSIISEGLALFTGQEIELEPRLAEERATGARIALRLMHWLVENGPLDSMETLTGPSGELLRLEPDAAGRLIKVWKT